MHASEAWGDFESHSEVDSHGFPSIQIHLSKCKKAASRVCASRAWECGCFFCGDHLGQAKYPKSRSISDNLTLLMSVVNKLDEEARNKTAQYNDFKTQRGNMAKKERGNCQQATPHFSAGSSAPMLNACLHPITSSHARKCNYVDVGLPCGRCDEHETRTVCAFCHSAPCSILRWRSHEDVEAM